MKYPVLVYWLFFFLWVSCNEANKQMASEPKNGTGKLPFKQKPPSSFSDTLLIEASSAVIYQPDSVQLLKIKTVTDSMVFKGSLHEFFYQIRNARMVLKKHYRDIKVIEAKNVRWLSFVKRNGEKTFFDLDTIGDPFGMILFDGFQIPKLVDMTNIDSELGFYFTEKNDNRK